MDWSSTNPPSYNWSHTEDMINAYVKDGISVNCLVAYTPPWANGMRDRGYPPSQPVEGEVVNFTNGAATLQHKVLITSQPDEAPVLVTPNPMVTSHHVDEILTTNFTAGQVLRCSIHPIVVSSAQVSVDEGNGWQLWTRVDSIFNSPDGATVYQVDRSGAIRFRNNSLFFYHGKIPATGSKVKVTYDSIDKVYAEGTDYTLDAMNGIVTRTGTAATGAIPVEDFNGPLNPAWHWLNPPPSFDVNTATPGNLHYTVNSSPSTGVGHFLYQRLSGSGDFSAFLRITASGKSAQTGIMIYQDANNWFRYAVTGDAGRPYLTQCQGGQVTVTGSGGQLGFAVYPPCWVTIRKSGDTWTVFTSTNNPNAPDGGYQVSYTFTQLLTWPLDVGISSVGTDSTGVDIDQFKLNLPSIPAGASVLAFYDYLDTKPWTDFLTGLVNHFKDRVKYWELWNEPDQGWCWNGGQDVYAVLLREGSKAVKQADPTANVISGGYANGATGYLDTVYKTIGNSYFDYCAWHPYLFSNISPDTLGWQGRTNGLGRSIMDKYGDQNKDVFFTEFASDSGVLGAGGGMNDRKQAEYGMRMFLWSRKMGYVNGINWWPIRDMNPVGTKEDDIYGSHAGLFYSTGKPKPIFWVYRNVASNKGVLFDLVSYDQYSNPIPASARYTINKVVIGAQDRSKIASVQVLTSLTATDDSCKPDTVAARFIGQANAGVFTVAVNTASSALVTEKWTVTAASATTFTVVGSVSGQQGSATVGVPFTSPNGVVTFTVPSAPQTYVSGDRFEFETFKGDGFKQIAAWQNNGSATGFGDISVNLPAPVDARYVSVQFTQAATTQSFQIDEIQIDDTSGNNVAAGKLYIVDGYQPYFKNALSSTGPALQLAMTGMPLNPKPGSQVHLVVTYTNNGGTGASNVSISFPLPANTTYLAGSATGGGVYDTASRTVRWILPTLATGATGTVAFDVTVN